MATDSTVNWIKQMNKDKTENPLYCGCYAVVFCILIGMLIIFMF